MSYIGRVPSAVPLAVSDIPDLPTSKITSGTFANSLISASSVSQHATSFDDNKIVNDLSTLAIRQASNENKSAYNTNSMYVDVFQDDTGIDTETNTDRNSSSEYMSSNIFNSYQAIDYFNPTQIGGGTTNYQYYAQGLAGDTVQNTFTDILNNTSGTGFRIRYIDDALAIANDNYFDYSPANTGDNYGIIVDFKEVKDFGNKINLGKHNTWGDISQYRVSYSNDNSTYTNIDFSSASQDGATRTGNSSAGNSGGFSSGTSEGIINMGVMSTSATHTNTFTVQGFPTFQARYLRLGVIALHSGRPNDNAGLASFQPFIPNFTLNATGNFTSNNITASSSISSMGAIITYQDAKGTNALNTDIVLQLSADGGSNFTTATLTALPDFSTGIKMAKVNDLSVTAGTSLKYKLSFANQSATKEARVRGVSLQY